MITTSSEYKTIIAQNSRHFETKIMIDGATYINLKGFKYKGGTNSSDEISFGDTVSACVEFALTDIPKNIMLQGKTAKPYVGLQLSNSIEWIPLGIFVLDRTVRSGNSLKITAYDNFTLCEQGFFSSLTGTKIAAILQEQCTKIGISYAGGADDVIFNAEALLGLTIREAIGILAAYCGKNAVMDREGNLKFVWCNDIGLNITNDRYASPIDMSESDTYIGALNCAVDNETSLTVGTGVGINFSCPGMTQDRLQILFDRVKGFAYRSAKLDWKMAQPDIEAGDIIKAVGADGSVYKIPLMEFEINCDGGCYAAVQSKGKTAQEQEHYFKGPLSTKVERTYTEIISTKQLLADTITAFTGNFETINTNYLNVAKKITAAEADITDLKSKTITTETLTAELAKINQAIIGKADITDLTAATGKINILESDVSTITTLLAGSTTSGSIHTITLNAENTTISNALIKSAMIDTLAFNKITGVDINTTSLTVHSNDGKSQWADNTIQISDAQRVRVQIGKDASNDYNMYVWDGTGKLMFDATGVTANGIQRPIIVDSMVSDNANISGDKLNITSVVKEINDSSETIKSSHIVFDETGQSFDVAFSEMQTTIETIEHKKMYRIEIISSNGIIFKNTNIQTVLSARVWSWDEDVTDTLPDILFTWTRVSDDKENDEYWNNEYGKYKKKITVTNEDVDQRATFFCDLNITQEE